MYYHTHMLHNTVSSLGQVLGSGLDTDLVAFYSFDNTLVDDINANNATGTPVYSAGKINNAIQIVNLADSLTIPDNDVLSFTNGTNDLPFSIQIWVYINSFNASFNFVFTKRVPGPEYQLIIEQTGKINALKFSLVGTANQQGIISNSTITTGYWNHIVWTDDGTGTNAGMKIYINGTLSSSAINNKGTYVRMSNSTAPIILGEFSNLFLLNGKIDLFGVWKNRELSQSDVTQLYNGGVGLAYSV